MSRVLTQRASKTERYSVLGEAESLARQCVLSVKSELHDVESGDKLKSYPSFAPSDGDTVSIRIDEELAKKKLATLVSVFMDEAALAKLGMEPQDVLFFGRVRDLSSGWTHSSVLEAIDEGAGELLLEFQLSELLPREDFSNTEISVDVLSKKPPAGFKNWTPSRKLSSFCLQHANRESVTEFPPVWISAEDFKNRWSYPEETLAYFQLGDLDDPVTQTVIFVNADYKDVVLGTTASSTGISRNFLRLVKAEILEAALMRKDFDLEGEYSSGSVGMAIQNLLKAEGHRAEREGLAAFREGRDEDDVRSLARLCATLGKTEVRSLLR